MQGQHTNLYGLYDALAGVEVLRKVQALTDKEVQPVSASEIVGKTRLPFLAPWLNASQMDAALKALASQSRFPLEEIEAAHGSLLGWWAGGYGEGNSMYSTVSETKLRFYKNNGYQYTTSSSGMLVGLAVGAGSGYGSSFSETGLCVLSSPTEALFLSDKGRNVSGPFSIEKQTLYCKLGVFIH